MSDTFKKLFEGVEGVTVTTIKETEHKPDPENVSDLSRNLVYNGIAHEIDEAERKAIDSLARYKFAMFGYWAGIWVHLNRIEGNKRPSPFKRLVTVARLMREQSK